MNRDLEERREGVPRVEAASLRDHGGRERVERVWERLEPKLSLHGQQGTSRRRRPLDRYSVASLAAVAGFALGIGVAGWVWQRDRPNESVVVRPAGVEPVLGLFATGGTGQSYALPGGDGSVQLRPDTTVETIGRDDGLITLRLRRGDAIFTAPAGVGAVRVIIGDARITSRQGGQFQVRRDGDYAYLQVISGSAEVTPPDEQPSVLAANRTALVPIHSRVTTKTPAPYDPVDAPPRHASRQEPHDEETSDSPTEVAPPPPEAAWVTACKRDHDDQRTVQLLAEQPGAIDQITDPQLLGCIAVGYESLGNQDAAAAALEKRVQHDPDKYSALAAAKKLVRIYEKRKNAATNDADRQKWAARVAQLKNKERELSLAALAQSRDGGESLEAFESESGLCSRINSEASLGNTAHVINLAALYKSAYPDGPCTAAIDAILAKIGAEGGASTGAEVDPYEADAGGS
jgi:ferric-dicitrate binding protein FerR (iron transport regulator)